MLKVLNVDVSPLEIFIPYCIGAVTLCYFSIKSILFTITFIRHWFSFVNAPQQLLISLECKEIMESLEGYPKFNPELLKYEKETVYLWDPSTYDYFGSVPAMKKDEIEKIVDKSRIAHDIWKKSTFSKRKEFLRVLLRYVTENQELCARISVKESGKTLLDALFGEILVTCEKLTWLIESGEQYLLPEYRSTGKLMLMKTARVEYIPLGVIGAIVPWNYPFHNIMNPISASLFCGNSIVIKVSEYASWSIKYYKQIIDAALKAVDAPVDLVQFVVGYAESGDALVRSNIDKLIFVGSPAVGAIVAKAAADKLTPVVLELGGKDPFIVCDDVNVKEILQVACRGVWQSCGQNCAGPERFLVYERVYDEFIYGVLDIVKSMKPVYDYGSICMGPRQFQHYQRLV